MVTSYEQHRTDNRRRLILIIVRWNPVRIMRIDYYLVVVVVVDYYYLLEVMSCCTVVSRMMNLFVIVYVHDYYDADEHYCHATATRSTIVSTTPVIHHIHSIEIGAVLSSCPVLPS